MEYEIKMNENRREDAAFLAKWYGYLFLLIIPSIIGNIMTNDTVVEILPILQRPGQVLTVITNLIWAVILLKLKDYSDKLAFAGWGMIGLAIWGVLDGLWLSNLGFAVVISLIAVIVSLVVVYHEYYGHGEILNDYDVELAEKWRKLWKWEIISLGATLGSIVFAVIIPIIGVLVVLAGAVALVVVSILKWVYLYQTKKFFEEYTINETYRDIPAMVDADYIPSMQMGNNEENVEDAESKETAE